ncbi:hypothetical protein DICSQDRAFT_175140 [Dichomitus squalens LYAD-421 SS1]|uniref:Uncharacterized protein n=2 Tax=Dichomitus squalens TaxID=114155 RepID=A0A4Q9MYU5_9APHY|nr:uncharacterized protein DICSQDRAFT_175140 [Dichomitus squalens LYAD-421 SS1]EJF56158.1 hypothetical protein DICSQDRAFT_175140 [Dichomitus squalens LYAD-421 SS1]TBU31942.1 hypothetical protein BD311DRAFT_655871 [Dichomitus squalens]
MVGGFNARTGFPSRRSYVPWTARRTERKAHADEDQSQLRLLDNVEKARILLVARYNAHSKHEPKSKVKEWR